jgi:hypothetical protein
MSYRNPWSLGGVALEARYGDSAKNFISSLTDCSRLQYTVSATQTPQTYLYEVEDGFHLLFDLSECHGVNFRVRGKSLFQHTADTVVCRVRHSAI